LIRIMCCATLLALAGRSALPDKESHTARTTAFPASCRTFTVHYVAKVPGVAAGGHRLDVWLPVPRSDAQQNIAGLSVKTDLPHEIETDFGYGNSVLHAWNEHPETSTIDLAFSCTRFEEDALGKGQNGDVSCMPTPRDLEPDRLGAIDDRIRETARKITGGQPDALAKARAIYDYVIEHMRYDKTAPGWGTGDTLRACRVGKGNCTDFHALFISLSRAAGIPARFEIGFPLPGDQPTGKLEGYHCWAEFWIAGTGWVPVDCSEAWKHPQRREFYFGNLDPNRFCLSVGRDIRLPGMKGAPLNYLINPYAEADGKPAGPVSREISFRAGDAAAG